ncbi:hypothetical protein [Moraxella marmotae]|uniref:hypothetical protein n=1 Tax=Moraxella marmotae TaxID=3344520 RepID=UPI0035F2B34E
MQTISFEVDDVYYQELISQVGKDNLSDFFQKVSEPYLWLNKKAKADISSQSRPYRLGALPNIKIPDNFDDIEIADFDI